MSNINKEEFLKQILKDGEEYSGILLGKNGDPDIHLILLNDRIESVIDKYFESFTSICRDLKSINNLNHIKVD